MRWFRARTRGEVLWVDPYPTRLPTAADWRRVGRADEPVDIVVPDWLRLVRPRALPIEPLPGSTFINRPLWCNTLERASDFLAAGDAVICIGKPSALALDVLRGAAGVPAVYDAMDDFPAFYSGLSKVSMRRREGTILAQVSRVLVSSTALAGRFAAQDIEATLALNACATDTLPPVAALPPRPAKEVIGYVGTIGAWFDWELVTRIAKENPQAQLRLIGPLYLPPPGALPANVSLVPACDHAAAIRAMTEFSVGLIPFRLTPLTASVDPIKYYEYRALGLPVASTRFGEMALRGQNDGVLLIGAEDELSNLVRVASHLVPTHAQQLEFRTKNSWEARFDAAGIIGGL
ncbi:MAG: glycosyl transferase [Pseudomonadota bacterium]